MIGIFSPTYMYYKKCKMTYCSETSSSNRELIRSHNKLLSENIKFIFLIITLNSLLLLDFNYIVNNIHTYNILEQMVNIVVGLVGLYLSYKWALKITPSKVEFNKIEINRCLKIYFGVIRKPIILNIFIQVIGLITIYIYHIANHGFKIVILIVVVYYFGISRVSHFYMVFVADTFRKLEKRTDGSILNKPQGGLLVNSDMIKRKVYIVLMSYLSLIFEYSIVYYILANRFTMFSKEFKGIIEAIYYSLITITTIGYGDFYPICNLSQIFVMSEIISGMFLLILTLVTYMGEE